MALDSPYYLAAGSLVIEDGTDAAPYHPVGIWLPAPAPDGVGGHVPAVRRFRVKVTGTSTATLTANTAALQQACVRDETLYFRASGSGDILSCRIREASVVEDEVDLLGALRFERYVTVTLTTDPYWLAPWGAWVKIPSYVTSVDIAGPGGDDDALLDMMVANGGYTSDGIYLGAKPDKAVGFLPREEITQQKTLSDQWQAFSTAPITGVANTGTYIPLVAFGGAQIASTTHFRSTVTTHSVQQPYPATTTTTRSGFSGWMAELPPITIPSAAIPPGFDAYVTHEVEALDDNDPQVELWSVTRIPIDYAAAAVRSVIPADRGVYIEGETGAAYDIEWNGSSMAVGVGITADIIRPLRVRPTGTTTYVLASTGGGLRCHYRTRPRYLTATG